MCRSLPQIPAEVTRTIASPGPSILGSGTVSTDTWLAFLQTIARIGLLLPDSLLVVNVTVRRGTTSGTMAPRLGSSSDLAPPPSPRHQRCVASASEGKEGTTMKATKFLEQQHREVEALFKQLEKAKAAGPRRTLFDKIADAVAIHSTIEERHFYPAVQDRATAGTLLESLEEHLAIKRVIADLLELEGDDPTFLAKAKVLKDEIEHHVEEEEHGLFPVV